MKNSHRFFSNKECMYFPCHENPTPDGFNCLFCYCPLYGMADCGGVFSHSRDGSLKLCMDCPLPHEAGYYDEIIRRLTKI